MTLDKTTALAPIGVIRSPFRSAAGTPVQPAYAEKCEGQVVVDERREDRKLADDRFQESE
jgi:tRNA (Thr-GGU) A37 N-methylase